MAKGQGKPAGKAYVKLTLDDSELVKGLKNSQRKMAKFGESIGDVGTQFAKAGLAITAPMMIATKVFASAGDELNEMSERTGVAVESLSALKFAAEQGGADVAALEKGLRVMTKTIGDAERGLSTAIDAFNLLGISLGDLKKLSPQKQFETIAEKIAAIEDPTQKAYAAMMVFGAKSGTALIPMMKNLSSVTKEAEELGIVMSTDDAQAAADLDDEFNRTRRTIEMLAVSVGSALTPALRDLSEYLRENTRGISAWVNENSGLITGLLFAGIALTAFGVALKAVGFAISSIAGGVGILVKVAALLKYILTLGGGISAAALLPLLGKIALVAAAVIASFKISQVIAEWTGFDRIAAWVLDKITDMLGYVTALAAVRLVAEWTGLDKILASVLDKINGITSGAEKAGKIGGLGKILSPEGGKAIADNEDVDTSSAKELAKIKLETEKERLKLVLQGIGLRREELDIERREAIALAGSDADKIAAIREQFAVKQQLLDMEEKAEQAEYAKRKRLEGEQAMAEYQAEIDEKRLNKEDQIFRNRELALELEYEGYDLEKKKLELAKEAALARTPAYLKKAIEEEFALRNKLADKSEAEQRAKEAASRIKNVATSMGTFASSALDRVFGRGNDKQLAEQKKSNELLKRINEKIGTSQLAFA